MDASETRPGERNRVTVDVAENSDELHGNREIRRRAGGLRLAFVAFKAVAEGRAQWRNPELKARWGATHTSAAEGEEVAIFAWIAGERNLVLGQELTEEEEKLRGSW